MKANKIKEIIKRIKDEIIVTWRNQEFKLHRSTFYQDAWEGENETNFIVVSLLDGLDDMTLIEKLQYAVDNYRSEVKAK